MADPSGEKRDNHSSKIINGFSLATMEKDNVNPETESPVKLAEDEISCTHPAANRGI